MLKAGGDGEVTAALAWAEAVVGPVAAVRPSACGTSTMLALTGEAGDDTVLRLVTRQQRRSHGHALTTASQIQQLLEGTPVPAPRSLALDTPRA